MKRLSYSDEFLVTDDEVAELVLEYAAALARTADADVVHIPVVDRNGDATTAALLLGPSSEIVAVQAAPEKVELDTEVVLRTLHERISAHTALPLAAVVDDHPELSGTYSDDY